MFDVVLYQPEIPPNTGNIIRLCANTGVRLHLIHPLGFTLEHRQLRRAGLDYDEYASVQEYQTLDEFLTAIKPTNLYAASTRGTVGYTDIDYKQGDAIVFGPETRGLPAYLLSSLPEQNIVRIPMQKHSRSLNLSNAVAVIVYEGLRQNGFVFT